MESDTQVLQFMQLANCNFETAKSYVEMSGGDLNRAFELYSSFQNAPPTQQPMIPIVGGDRNGEDDIPSPTPQRVSNLLYDDVGRGRRPAGPRINLPNVVNDVMNGLTSFLGNRGRGDGRRRGGGGGGRERNQRKKPRSKFTDGSEAFQNLFTPPQDLLFQGSFDQAKNFAAQKKMWLLVNIQSENVFPCLELNRDCWKNDLIKEFVQKNFVFFQRDVIHDEGLRFQSLYMKGVYTFPYIAIIDPRTGAEEKRWIGKVESNDLYNHLVEFIKGHDTLESNEQNLPSVDSVQPLFSGGDTTLLNNNNNNNNNNLLQPRPPTSSSFPTASTEDQLLQMAINESLKDAQNQEKMVDEGEESEELIFEEDEEDNNTESDVITSTDTTPESEKGNNRRRKKDDEDEVEFEEEVVHEEEEDEDKVVGYPDESINLELYVGKNAKGDKARIQLILPNGKREVITVIKTAPLAVIYACFRSKLSEEQKGGRFQVVFFNRTLENTLERTIQDDKLLGASLSLNFE